jgi:hypothetical protein
MNHDTRDTTTTQPFRDGVCLSAMILGLLLAGSTLAEDSDGKAGRLSFMKGSVADYVIQLRMSGSATVRRVDDPLLRWDNPVSKVPDGTLFLWTDDQGRPVTAAQVFIAGGTQDLWLHEFQSLTTSPFRVTRRGSNFWTPDRGGVEFQPLTGSPAPAESKVARLVQMRELAKRFEAEDEFEGKSRWELRLLTTPVYRYGSADTVPQGLIDGAIFAYAHGTDPECLLLLEARTTDQGPAWYYALAPMTGYALKVKYDGRDLWSVPWRKGPYDIREPFVCLPYQP